MPLDRAAPGGRLASVADYAKIGLMIPQVRGQEPAGVLKELSEILGREGCVPEPAAFLQAAINRETLVSTAMDHGLAFPHARLNGLTQLWFALGRSRQPISWGPQGATEVHLVFLLAVPSTAATTYLHLLSGLARLGKETRWRESLHAAQTASDMWAVLQQLKFGKSQ